MRTEPYSNLYSELAYCCGQVYCSKNNAILLLQCYCTQRTFGNIADNAAHCVFTFWNSSLVFKSPWMLLSAFKCQANSAILHSAKLQCNVVSLCSNCIILTVSVTAHSLPKKYTSRNWSRKTRSASKCLNSHNMYIVQWLCSMTMSIGAK